MRTENFNAEEFRDWADEMSPRLLTMFDVLRYQLGRRVIISPHPYSLGRNLGRDDMSAHNIDHWGEVLAGDFFVDGVTHREAVEDVARKMKLIGFTGIGVYSDTHYIDGLHPMFHGDVRPNEKMGDPATWGRVFDGGTDINGNPTSEYTSLMAAIQSVTTGV
jgi:hypothetical protein